MLWQMQGCGKAAVIGDRKVTDAGPFALEGAGSEPIPIIANTTITTDCSTDKHGFSVAVHPIPSILLTLSSCRTCCEMGRPVDEGRRPLYFSPSSRATGGFPCRFRIRADISII